MSFSQDLKYGGRGINLDFKKDDCVYDIKEPEPRTSINAFRQQLESRLEKLEPDVSNVAVIVADKTRLCGYATYLKVLLDALELYGALRDRTTLYIAYGTHARQDEAISRSIYGESYDRYRFVHHDCTDEGVFSHLGKTRRGTPVMIRKDILDASFRITFGAVSHHYFAGYGGGRKLIFPGLGFRDAIYHNHGLFLDKGSRALASGCLPGCLDGNPIAEDLEEVETCCPAHLAIHGILDSRGRVCDLHVGTSKTDFRASCRDHGKNCEISDDGLYDMVVASCGGFPKDINFIQSHKAIHNAAAFVRDGKDLIVFAECRDGIGSKTFLPWFEIGSQDEAFDRLAQNYEGNGGTALAMMAKTKRVRVHMVTALDAAILEKIAVRPVSVDQVSTMIRKASSPVAVIPHAGLLVKKSL